MNRAMTTVRAGAEIDRIFAQGRRSSERLVTLIAIATPEAREPSGRVLFVAAKRLGSAVRRNKSKRVLREAARRAGAPWPGWDVALVAREGTAEASADEMDRALDKALGRLRATASGQPDPEADR